MFQQNQLAHSQYDRASGQHTYVMSLRKKERATLTVLVSISPWQLKSDLGVFCNIIKLQQFNLNCSNIIKLQQFNTNCGNIIKLQQLNTNCSNSTIKLQQFNTNCSNIIKLQQCVILQAI